MTPPPEIYIYMYIPRKYLQIRDYSLYNGICFSKTTLLLPLNLGKMKSVGSSISLQPGAGALVPGGGGGEGGGGHPRVPGTLGEEGQLQGNVMAPARDV